MKYIKISTGSTLLTKIAMDNVVSQSSQKSHLEQMQCCCYLLCKGGGVMIMMIRRCGVECNLIWSSYNMAACGAVWWRRGKASLTTELSSLKKYA